MTWLGVTVKNVGWKLAGDKELMFPCCIVNTRRGGDTETVVDVGVTTTGFTVNVTWLEVKPDGKRTHSVQLPTVELGNEPLPVQFPEPSVTLVEGLVPAGDWPTGVQSCVPSGWMAQRLKSVFRKFEAKPSVHAWPTVKFPEVAPLIVKVAEDVAVATGLVTVKVTRFEVKFPEFGNSAHSVQVPTVELGNDPVSDQLPFAFVGWSGMLFSCAVQSCVPSGWMAQSIIG